ALPRRVTREGFGDDLADGRVGEARRARVRPTVTRRRVVVPRDARLQPLGGFAGGEAEARHHGGAIAEIARGLGEAVVGALCGAREVAIQPGEAHPASIPRSDTVDRVVRERRACVIVAAMTSALVGVAYADGAG